MDFTKGSGGGLSPAELAFLGVLALLCLAALWTLYRRWSGRTRSDVSGLRLTRRDR